MKTFAVLDKNDKPFALVDADYYESVGIHFVFYNNTYVCGNIPPTIVATVRGVGCTVESWSHTIVNHKANSEGVEHIHKK